LNTTKKDLVMWFGDLRKTDIPLVGGKNANLGEMISAGLPVPPGCRDSLCLRKIH